METVSRRTFLERVAAAGTLAAVSPRMFASVSTAEPGFRGTLCFFSKHLPRMDAPGLGRALKKLGFGGVDLTVRPGGHVDPKRVAQDLPVFVAAGSTYLIALLFVHALAPTLQPVEDTP